MNFKDEQIINCTLISLKHLRIMAAYFAEEAGTNELFNEANTLFEDITQMQRATYDKMIEEGFMSVEPQTKQAIEKAYKKVQKMIEEMS